MLALSRLSASIPKTVCASTQITLWCNFIAFGRYISWTGKAAENTYEQDDEPNQ